MSQRVSEWYLAFKSMDEVYAILPKICEVLCIQDVYMGCLYGIQSGNIKENHKDVISLLYKTYWFIKCCSTKVGEL